MEAILEEIRNALADYMDSEGCECCRRKEDHKANKERLAKLLNVPAFPDGSGYDFSQFETKPIETKPKIKKAKNDTSKS